ncbi:MAG: SGNH/GDSL hydrolase family protein, partial [Gemmataceae bacterium]|nr:SGNH/GDSL hydrolase family protein [Gemmataceae bacterium]
MRNSPLGLERLEGRDVPTAYTLTPVVPTLDAALTARLAPVVQRGAGLGNRPNVFARAGDSITFASAFLTPLAAPNPGTDATGDGSLTDSLNYFRSGRVGASNPFNRPSSAALGGLTAAQVLALLPGELAATKPAFVLVMVGTNDVSLDTPLDAFRQTIGAIAQTALDAGVVPVLSTIPDMSIAPELAARQPGYNQVIQDVAEAAQVPLWNYWRALQRLPNQGISADGVHPSVAPTGGADLGPAGLNYGYNVRNLTALQTLDKLRRVLLSGQPPDTPNPGAAWAPMTGAIPIAAGDTTGFQVQVLDATS